MHVIMITKRKIISNSFCVEILGRRKETSASFSALVSLSACPCFSEGIVVI